MFNVLCSGITYATDIYQTYEHFVRMHIAYDDDNVYRVKLFT